MDTKKCPIVVDGDGKECGLDLTPTTSEDLLIVGLHTCPLGHRTYVMPSLKDKAP